ncbi:MAG: PolC-type DNA polymerase III [Lachnospiraceae bacterium]|nr:PolC-type DNA polymerase III [Lachnospiraceae bacterium]
MEDGKISILNLFQSYRPSKILQEYFEDVYIDKVRFSRRSKVLHIFVVSGHLIHQQYVQQLEYELLPFARSAVGGAKCVDIQMEYRLSERYQLKDIYEEYADSLLYEIKYEDPINYLLVKDEAWVVNDNVITIPMPDSDLAKCRFSEIQGFLTELFRNRFQLDIQVGFNYKEEDKEALREAHEKRLQQEREQHQKQLEQLRAMELAQHEREQYTGEDASKDSKNKDIKAKDGNNKDGKIKVAKTVSNTPKMENSQRANGKNVSNGKDNAGGFRRSALNSSKDPDVFYGRNCEGEIIPISDIQGELGEVVVHGQIIKLETREIRNNKTIVTFHITDFTDTISGKVFLSNDDLELFLDMFKSGGFYRIKGIVSFDTFANDVTIGSIVGIKKGSDFRVARTDESLEKRVELHMHTVMSDKDSVVDIAKIIKRAKAWGHKGIAITDHGVVQAFPIANHVLDSGDDFKIIYGVEGYFVDDLKSLIIRSKGQTFWDTFVVFDIETTGKNAKFHKITEIGAVKIEQGRIVDRYSQLVNPERPIPYNITRLTGITDEMVANQPNIETVLPQFLDFCGDAVVVAHNASFDTGFIANEARKQGLEFSNTILDTLGLAHILLPHLGKFTLDRLVKELKIVLENHHRAVDDAEATAEMFLKFVHMLMERDVENLDQLNALAAGSPDNIKKSRRYHGIILAKNEVGRVNLYRLISMSHLEYFNRRPLMPKSMINKYREGLIIGSACEAGELYQALLNGADDGEITRIVDFYDYLEIQPLGNNMFMIEDDNYPIESVEDLMEYNRKIVQLGEEFHKPVAATCDVHFLDPEDSIYRAIIQASEGFKDVENQSPLYFRTTDEMLKEFEYLGADKAREVVITNTNRIADMIEYIKPVRPDKCPPIIENSDETLTQICYDRAHEIYGPDLPTVVVERLERELNSIISNGFAVLYIIAQKLVWDSNDHGYLVGSRGSVGSSFVATMAGITEVNPLSPHYICPECHFVDFDSPEVLAFSGNSGCDMPDRDCPKCGHKLLKEGHDIPFETFLGFKGDKEPDIDLNFSGEYQANAHQYTEELFTKGHAFRAGTIGTIADKTAYGMAMKFFEERKIKKRSCEIERLSVGCTGVKRTTGQHPGGMIVLPKHEEIYSFTPIQHPANDQNTPIITTHFEYHSIDHNLLKLDILGHDDPTMIRRLEDLTGVDCKTIPLDDKQVMSLFSSTEALGITPEDIGGVPLGSLGIPEFGTEFAMQMLIDTKPTMFSDLVRIAGLAHGTDVWLGNAQELIKSGKAVISTAICCRDDIMVYLIHKGMDKGLSFTIMESVRKGKGLKPEWEEEMLAHDVPDWYIWSCKKIKYMFPKAHAAAYVMMAWRIAWYKINYPLEYYAAFFSIRADAFNYETMCLGRSKLEYHMEEIRKSTDKTNKDLDSLKDMKLVLEMYARGFEFLPIDIYRADAERFQIMDGKIMPALCSIEGLGGKAATQVQEAAKEALKAGGFSSKDNLREMAKIGKSTIEKFTQLGLLNDIPDSDQFSLFDYMGQEG